MGTAALKDLYLDELGVLYDAEKQMIRTLPRLAEAAHGPELRDLLTKHCQESRLHLERIELIFTHWGARRTLRSSAGLAGIVQEADERLNQEATPDLRDAAIIGVAQRIEHYEIAAYGCARRYARRLNRSDEVRLLQETLNDEERAEHRLVQIADNDAWSESDVTGAWVTVPPSRAEKPTEEARGMPNELAPDQHGEGDDETNRRQPSENMVAHGGVRADDRRESPTPLHGDKLG